MKRGTRENSWRDTLYFRAIQRSDLPQVCKLHEALFPVRYSQDFYESLLNTNYYLTLVAVTKEEEIVGFITARIKKPSWFACCFKEDTEDNVSQLQGYISTIGVSETYQVQGLGSYLLEEMILMLKSKKCPCITLHVKADNISAIKFYQKNGFKIAKELQQFYFINGKWHDALFMCKYIPGSSNLTWWQSFTQLFSFSKDKDAVNNFNLQTHNV